MPFSITAAVLATALAGGVGFAVPAEGPEPGAGLEEIQAAAERATDNRIRSIENALDRLAGNAQLSDEHRAQIEATLQDDLDAMRDLQSGIAAEDSAAEARAAYRSIFTDYRVYAVVLPQALYAAAADGLTDAALPRLEDAHDALAGEVAESGDAELETTLAEMAASIDEAHALLDGLADAALAVTPADYNDDRTVLGDVRTDLRDAVGAVRDAGQDAQEIVEALR